jgi:four helix bundle protein
MRDHTKLRAFQLADSLALATYQTTKTFPSEERFGLTAQMRRAAVSIASNIVEGCAKSTEPEYLRYLDTAYGSARELEYQISLAQRLGYLRTEIAEGLAGHSVETSKVLGGLIRALRP